MGHDGHPGSPAPAPLPRSDSWLGASYAARVALAAGITVVIADLFDVQHAFWMTITAVIVLQPDLSGTRGKAVSRVIGTLVGAATGSLMAALLPYNPVTVAACVLFTILACWWIRRLREPMPLAAVTAVIVFYFSRHDHSLLVGALRCLEILAGVFIGLVVAMLPIPLPRSMDQRQTRV
ncbi:MAG: FUSC family protein [Phycisphaeraceae bacterium]|nr:FUSC family protein [Phycisphaeraceae bacterium]